MARIRHVLCFALLCGAMPAFAQDAQDAQDVQDAQPAQVDSASVSARPAASGTKDNQPGAPDEPPLESAQGYGAYPPELEPHDPMEEGGADSSPVWGWFRIDADVTGLRLWVGAVHQIFGVPVATDVWLSGSGADTDGDGQLDTLRAVSVFDIGVPFGVGPVSLLPMFGLGFDFTVQEGALIAPQLFTIVDTAPVYVESWVQAFFLDIFSTAFSDNYFYTRNFVLWNASNHFALGPQMELTAVVKDNSGSGAGERVSALPIGGRVNLHYGENNTLGLFLGYDTFARDEGRSELAGRFTFIRTW